MNFPNYLCANKIKKKMHKKVNIHILNDKCMTVKTT